MSNIYKKKILLCLAVGSIFIAVPFTLMAQTAIEQEVARLADIQERHQEELLNMPGVTGVATGFSEKEPPQVVIRVYVYKGTSPEVKNSLPKELDGAPVEIIEEEPGRPE